MNILYIFLYSCAPAIFGGIASFAATLKWFSIAEMLRSFVPEGLLFALFLLLPAKVSAIVMAVLFVPLLALAFTNVLHIMIYKSAISAFAIQSSMETSYNEATEFLAEFCTLQNAVVAALVIGLLLFLLLKAIRATRSIKRNKITLVVSLLLIAVLGGVALKKGDRLLRSDASYVILKTLVTHAEDIEKVKELKDKRKDQRFSGIAMLDESEGNAPAGRTYIIVVGESMNRHHMSLYDYGRETTPRLNQLRDKGELLVFEDVTSASTHTVPSLRSTLLFHDLDGEEDLLACRSVIGLFNASGFTTYWLSNQTANSDGLTGTAVIAGDAQVRRFFNRAKSEGHSVSYDEVLLPALEAALQEPGQNKAIFLHLIGSHLSYGLRYPDAFDHFTSLDDIPDAPWREDSKKKYINEYDNSIRYTDTVLDSIINIAQKQSGSVMMVYFSDHGQEVYDTLPIRGQDARNPSRNMFDVPFLCWLSPEYRDRNPEIAAIVEDHRQQPFSLADFSQSLAGLARISFTEYAPQRSLFAKEHAPQPRVLPNNFRYDDLPELGR